VLTSCKLHFFLRDNFPETFSPPASLRMGEAQRISAELQEMRTHFAAVRAGLEQRLAELERAVHRRVRSCARRHRCSFHQAVCCAGGFCVGQGNAANCGLHCACH
jgi:hypothetical protein